MSSLQQARRGLMEALEMLGKEPSTEKPVQVERPICDKPQGPADHERTMSCRKCGEGFVSRCTVHTVGTSSHYWWSACPACEQSAKDQAAAGLAKDRAAWRASKTAILASASGVAPRFELARLASFRATLPEQRQALATITEYLATFDARAWRPLLLLGPPGTGKTHCASALVSELIESRHLFCEISTFGEIVRALRATWSGGTWTEADEMERLARLHFLAIDDLGVSKLGESEARILFDVVNSRYERKRPVAISSNLTPHELAAVVGGRVWDRLAEGATFVPMQWPSHRRPTA